jgi:sugar/nucleoside kinase (ribokinase family)
VAPAFPGIILALHFGSIVLVVDTIGAGDAFTSGLLAGQASGLKTSQPPGSPSQALSMQQLFSQQVRRRVAH